MCPDASFVLVNDSLHGGQADSCPFEFFSAVEPLERTKELLGALRVETYAVVPHHNGAFAIDQYLADLDDGGIAGPGVLDGVGEQVGQNLPHQPAVTPEDRQIFDPEFDLPVRVLGVQLAQHFFDQLAQADVAQTQWLAVNLCQIEKVVYQTRHSFDSFINPVQVVSRLFAERGAIFFQQKACKTVKCRERSTQVVRDRIGKSFQ